MKKLLVVLLLTLSTPVLAEDSLWIHFGMLSKHFTSGDYNEDHELIGIEYNDWYVGYYPNSNFDDSFFIFKNYRWWQLSEHIHLGGRVGLLSGYDFGVEIAGTEVAPVLIPTLFLDFEPVSIDFNLLGAIYSVEFKFKVDL